MSFNPFIKVKLYCPVSADDARARLREVTQPETPWTFTAMPFIRYQSSGHRYIGVIKENRFRLFVKPDVPSGHTQDPVSLWRYKTIAQHRDRGLAIKGTIEPNGKRCTIHLTFQPKGIFLVMLPIWAAFLVYGFIDIVRRYGWELMHMVPLLFLGTGLYMARAFYFSSYSLEKDYLETLFTAQQLPTDSSRHVTNQQVL